jgi:hypothetical protein
MSDALSALGLSLDEVLEEDSELRTRPRWTAPARLPALFWKPRTLAPSSDAPKVGERVML